VNITIEMHNRLQKLETSTESHRCRDSRWTPPGPRDHCAFCSFTLQTLAHREVTFVVASIQVWARKAYLLSSIHTMRTACLDF